MMKIKDITPIKLFIQSKQCCVYVVSVLSAGLCRSIRAW